MGQGVARNDLDGTPRRRAPEEGRPPGPRGNKSSKIGERRPVRTRRGKDLDRREIFRARTPRGCLIGFENHAAAAETAPELIGDVALHRKEVLRRLVAALRPQMRVARRIDQLRGDTDLIALALHRTFEHIADVQVLADLPHIDSLAFVEKLLSAPM
jgi:hypothetical protein